VLDANDTCVTQVNLDNDAGLFNCTTYNETSGAGNNTGYCWRTIRVMIVTDQVHL
jgi:hypothetical protein